MKLTFAIDKSDFVAPLVYAVRNACLKLIQNDTKCNIAIIAGPTILLRV